MGWFSRLVGRESAPLPYRRDVADGFYDERHWGGFNTLQSATGININQATALSATAVMACTTMLAEDVAKLDPGVFERGPEGAWRQVHDHPLSVLMIEPNGWQDWLEFCEMMQVGLILRGNAFAVILRDYRGNPTTLVPINPDHVSLWESTDGGIFYRVTPMGFHETALLAGQPFLIPAEDMLHVRGFSLNGLMGSSRISLAKDAIGLAIAQEQQAARWMGNGARPSGILTTDGKLNPEAAKRMAQDWKDMHAGVANSGKTAVFEQGLKWQPLSLSASDMEFIASRQFQLQEIGRMFRIPPHMFGELSRSTNNNISQQSQEYVNYTLSGYTVRWARKLETKFGLRRNGYDMRVRFDFDVLTRADVAARYNAYRTGIMSMFLTPDEARIDDGRAPMGGKAAELQSPANMAAAGSQSTGTQADGGGRPEAGQTIKV